MTTCRLQSLASLLAVGIWVFTAGVSSADNFVQEVKNKSELTTANDLTLLFLNAAPKKVMITDPMGNNPRSPSTTDGAKATWNVGALPANVAPGESGKVTFSGAAGTKIDKKNSFWTENGNQIVESLASLGKPPDIIFDGGVFARITNPEAFALVYSDIRLYRDNDLANFNTSLFYTPTGQLVTGFPSEIFLGPGESVEFPFGSIKPKSYQLVLANVAAVTDPSDSYFVAAAAVPEPGTFSLLGMGCITLLVAYWRRRAAKEKSK